MGRSEGSLNRSTTKRAGHQLMCSGWIGVTTLRTYVIGCLGVVGTGGGSRWKKVRTSQGIVGGTRWNGDCCIS
jgi:hypothetical protein